MNTLRALQPLVDRHMLVVAMCAVVGTFLCRQANIIVDLPADLVSIAVIFPVVFSIASAYTRREDALKSFAALKADAASLYYAHRDWPDIQDQLGERGATLIREMLASIGDYFKASHDLQDVALHRVYRSFGAISSSYRDVLQAGASRSEISRLGAYLREVIAEFEMMRNFARYRTPIALRAFSRFFLTLFPVLFTPYFAYVGYPQEPWIGYAFAFMYGVVLVGLDNVQEQLEHPYDGVGPDDIHLAIADEFVTTVTESAMRPHGEEAIPRPH